ncbi:unnamed protein product [Periconia digitata]|uniref:Uncharacterized protein n=1 Tax=Periconia digitata TaxID=1303443 RepID=A0A9W4XSA3_9PLEO|nr:unnamed protein product [Periconia digitata]
MWRPRKPVLNVQKFRMVPEHDILRQIQQRPQHKEPLALGRGAHHAIQQVVVLGIRGRHRSPSNPCISVVVASCHLVQNSNQRGRRQHGNSSACFFVRLLLVELFVVVVVYGSY